MKAYIVSTDNHRDGFNIFTRNGLVKKLDPNDRRIRIYRTQLTATDCMTINQDSHIYYEGRNVSDAIDEIDRCDNWGVWAITVTTVRPDNNQMVDALFGFDIAHAKTYIVRTQDIIGGFEV